MGMATWYQGDALKVLRTLPDASVDLCMTSPPFLALRSYLDPRNLELARQRCGMFLTEAEVA